MDSRTSLNSILVRHSDHLPNIRTLRGITSCSNLICHVILFLCGHCDVPFNEYFVCAVKLTWASLNIPKNWDVFVRFDTARSILINVNWTHSVMRCVKFVVSEKQTFADEENMHNSWWCYTSETFFSKLVAGDVISAIWPEFLRLFQYTLLLMGVIIGCPWP